MQSEEEREAVRCITLFSCLVNVSFPLYDIFNKKEVIYPCREQASPIWIGPLTLRYQYEKIKLDAVMNMLM